MNHVIAYELLAAELATYRTVDFDQLGQLAGRTSHRKRAGNGIEYEISVIVRWCNGADGDIRVIGSIYEALLDAQLYRVTI